MTRFRNDHFEVGWWVTIEEFLGDPIRNSWGQEVYPSLEGPMLYPDYNGTPYKVLAVNMPFLCLTPDGYHRFGLDTRMWGLRILNPKFRKAMNGGPNMNEYSKETVADRKHYREMRKGKNRKKKNPKECPRCGSSLVERLQEPGSGNWVLVCRNCGMGGDLIRRY